MKIAIFPNLKKDRSKKIAKEIIEYLKNKKVEVFADEHVAEDLNVKPLTEIDLTEIDFTISLGGDGTILRLLHRHPELEAPMIGINLGSLGFMADIPIDDIYPSLEDILQGNYIIQERMVMEGTTEHSEICFAVNEVVIHRAQNPCLIDLSIEVDGHYLNTFSADGIIISTPSGSTAYSLAAGGPILTPELDAFVITPICPHTISNRPIVMMPKQIKVKYTAPYEPVEVIYDGFARYTISTNHEVTLTPSQKKFRLVSLLRHDYFTTLRTKLNWTGKLKF